MPWCPRSQSRCMMEGRLQIPLLHSPAPAGPVRPSPKTTPWAGFGGGWASGTSICVCVCVLGGEGRLRTLFPPQQAGGRQEGNPILQKHQPPTGTLPISGGVGLATDPRVTSLGAFCLGLWPWELLILRPQRHRQSQVRQPSPLWLSSSACTGKGAGPALGTGLQDGAATLHPTSSPARGPGPQLSPTR